nr:uncharacterized protein LOC120966458 [Aegilops tauschii subsp. strangulata]
MKHLLLVPVTVYGALSIEPEPQRKILLTNQAHQTPAQDPAHRLSDPPHTRASDQLAAHKLLDELHPGEEGGPGRGGRRRHPGAGGDSRWIGCTTRPPRAPWWRSDLLAQKMMQDRARSAPPRARSSRRMLGSLVVATAAADLEEDRRRVGEGDGAWQRLLATSVHGLHPQNPELPRRWTEAGNDGASGSGLHGPPELAIEGVAGLTTIKLDLEVSLRDPMEGDSLFADERTPSGRTPSRLPVADASMPLSQAAHRRASTSTLLRSARRETPESPLPPPMESRRIARDFARWECGEWMR